MPQFSIKDLARIIERDSKDATYKYAFPIELYHVMQVVSSFVTGTHSLIFRWAEFTSGIARSKDYYAHILEKQDLRCVWSGKAVGEGMHIDHMIPFVAIRNNDLWNLVPSRGDVNIRKSDRIPAGELLKQPSVKERILYYWDGLMETYPKQFRTEVQLSLLGNTAFSPKGWKNDSYDQLINISHHLIEDRGFSPWMINESI